MKGEIKKDDNFSYSLEDPKSVIIEGGDPSNPTWEEYLNRWKEEFQSYVVAIKEILEKENLIGTSAAAICNDVYFLFEDGTQIGFTWRGWGDLMQAIIDKKEGYMKYYM